MNTTTYETSPATVAKLKVHYARMDHLELIHEFKSLNILAHKYTSKGQEVPSWIWDSADIAEDELLGRMG